jgi:hypothetical protein
MQLGKMLASFMSLHQAINPNILLFTGPIVLVGTVMVALAVVFWHSM